MLKVAGHPLALAEFEPLRGAAANANRGEHVLHISPAHRSRVVVPFVEL